LRKTTHLLSVVSQQPRARPRFQFRRHWEVGSHTDFFSRGDGLPCAEVGWTDPGQGSRMSPGEWLAGHGAGAALRSGAGAGSQLLQQRGAGCLGSRRRAIAEVNAMKLPPAAERERWFIFFCFRRKADHLVVAALRDGLAGIFFLTFDAALSAEGTCRQGFEVISVREMTSLGFSWSTALPDWGISAETGQPFPSGSLKWTKPDVSRIVYTSSRLGRKAFRR